MAALTQLSLCFYLSKTGSCNGDIDFWVTLFFYFFFFGLLVLWAIGLQTATKIPSIFPGITNQSCLNDGEDGYLFGTA